MSRLRELIDSFGTGEVVGLRHPNRSGSARERLRAAFDDVSTRGHQSEPGSTVRVTARRPRVPHLRTAAV